MSPLKKKVKRKIEIKIVLFCLTTDSSTDMYDSFLTKVFGTLCSAISQGEIFYLS